MCPSSLGPTATSPCRGTTTGTAGRTSRSSGRPTGRGISDSRPRRSHSPFSSGPTATSLCLRTTTATSGPTLPYGDLPAASGMWMRTSTAPLISRPSSEQPATFRCRETTGRRTSPTLRTAWPILPSFAPLRAPGTSAAIAMVWWTWPSSSAPTETSRWAASMQANPRSTVRLQCFGHPTAPGTWTSTTTEQLKLPRSLGLTATFRCSSPPGSTETRIFPPHQPSRRGLRAPPFSLSRVHRRRDLTAIFMGIGFHLSSGHPDVPEPMKSQNRYGGLFNSLTERGIPMRFAPRYFLFGLCLSLVGASPAREKASSGWSDSLDATSKSMRALVAGEDGRLSVQAARRRFEFGEGELAISTGDSSWTYRFQGSRGGIRALSISTLPEQRTSGSLEYTHG